MRTVVTEKEGCVLFPAVTGLQADGLVTRCLSLLLLWGFGWG